MRRNGLMNSIFSAPVWAPEGVDGGGAGDAPAAESVLFPDENKPADDAAAVAAVAAAADGEGDKGAVDWKEYANDPAKTADENAALKLEHDKTKPAAGDDKAKDADDAVPADGKYTLAMPEGVEVDQPLLDAITPTLIAKGFTGKEAQALVDEFIKVQTDRIGKQGENWATTISGWVDTAKADKDIGGDKWDATVASATRATNALGTPALKEYLNASGGGNHPELIRFMAKVGAMIKEDNPAVGGAEGKGKPVDPAHILFANDAPKG